MRKSDSKGGFSLTEVLLAVGTLAIGMLLVAGVFPVSIRFTTIATERTIAAVVADEAFAKIKLYATYTQGDPCDPNDDIALALLPSDYLTDLHSFYPFIPDNEFAYPSDPVIPVPQKQYFWAALCRRLPEDYLLDLNDPNSFNSINRLVQVTVFVSRRISPNLRYSAPDPNITPQVLWPMPVQVGVLPGPAFNELFVDANKLWFINDGSTIVDNYSGRIYRVLERYAQPDNMILLDRNFDVASLDVNGQGAVWLIPPPVGGGRYPCIAVYQKIIRF